MRSALSGRSRALDGVLGCAVLLLILNHTGALSWGWVGVDVFFTYSGFLLTTLLFEEHERAGRVSLKRLHQRRARRLLPALLILLIAVTVARTRFGLFPSRRSLWKELGSALLYVNNWVMASGRSPVGPFTVTWALAEEAQFALLWPVVLFVLRKLRARPTVILAVLLGAIAVIYFYLPHLPLDAHQLGFYNVFDRGGELLIGCVAAIVYRYRLTSYVTRWSLIGIAAAVAIGWCADASMYPLRPRLIGAAAAAGLLILHAVTEPRSLLSRVLALPPLHYPGRISYGLYLYHLAVLLCVEQALPHSSWEVRTAIDLAITIALAAASWQFIESRFLVADTDAPTPPTLSARRPS
jgi:peptidoglycan/LPS O-acetylase OafA/YrhL